MSVFAGPPERCVQPLRGVEEPQAAASNPHSVASVPATACICAGLSTLGLSSVETVNAEAYIMMVWPSGSACCAT